DAVYENGCAEARRRLTARPIDRDGGSEIIAGRIAADRDARRIAAVFVNMGDRPLDGEAAIVERRRKRMLRREPIVDADDQRTAFGETVRQLAMAGRIAGDPRAAVEIDEHRKRSVADRYDDVGSDRSIACDERDALVKRADLRQTPIQ